MSATANAVWKSEFPPVTAVADTLVHRRGAPLRIGLVLCRYTLAEDGRRPLSAREQLNFIEDLVDERPIAYRIREPSPDDFDTYVMRVRAQNILHRSCIIWEVVRDIRMRQILKADRKKQTLTAEFVDADEAEAAKIVAVPQLGVLAAHDTAREGALSASSALSRFAAIARAKNHEFDFRAAGTAQDLDRAVKKWALDEFSFQVRPFNPHPANPGKMLSDLLATDEIGELRGVAKPKQGSAIHAKDTGMVTEAMGLSAKGYGTYGAKGRTASGAEAVVKKQSFSHDRDKNLERMRGPQELKVYIDADAEREDEKKTVEVLIEFFDQGEDQA